jgi:hypothetical protein
MAESKTAYVIQDVKCFHRNAAPYVKARVMGSPVRLCIEGGVMKPRPVRPSIFSSLTVRGHSIYGLQLSGSHYARLLNLNLDVNNIPLGHPQRLIQVGA